MQQTRLAKEGELFFRQWLRSPKSMGSVIPSSKFLARAVANEVAWQPGQYVVELGGGTGAITAGPDRARHPAREPGRDRARRLARTASSRSACPAAW